MSELIGGVGRLNTKIEPRELAVVDLVKDLSDGVSGHSAEKGGSFAKQIGNR